MPNFKNIIKQSAVKRKNFLSIILVTVSFGILLYILTAMTTGKKTFSQNKWKVISSDSSGIILVQNTNGPTLGYSSSSGVKIITADRLAFKDLNKNGKLDKYQDWRLSADERAKDLASKMGIDDASYFAHF